MAKFQEAQLSEQEHTMRREILIGEVTGSTVNVGAVGVLLGLLIWYLTGNFLSPFTTGLSFAALGFLVGSYDAFRLWWYWHHPHWYEPNRPC